ncbi:MAG: hypothetical protein HY855_20675, partial [Burkholderiales bacterium]|nr:hypothetical protein [Burkholderiales bacterium]
MIDPSPAAASLAGAGALSGYREWPLPPALQARIEAGWTFRAGARALYCVPPDGRIDLVLRARVDSDGRLSQLRAVIAGPGWQPSWVPADAHTLMAGLRFVPGWGGACLGVDPAELRGRVLLGEAAERIVRRCTPGLLRLRTQAQLPEALAAAACTLAARAQPAGGEARAAAAAAVLAAEPGLPV